MADEYVWLVAALQHAVEVTRALGQHKRMCPLVIAETHPDWAPGDGYRRAEIVHLCAPICDQASAVVEKERRLALRNSAQSPQGVLQPLAKTLEALGLTEPTRLPVRVDGHVVDPAFHTNQWNDLFGWAAGISAARAGKPLNRSTASDDEM